MRKPVIAVTSSKKEISGLPFEYILYSASHAEVSKLTERGAVPVIPPFLSDEEADSLMAVRFSVIPSRWGCRWRQVRRRIRG